MSGQKPQILIFGGIFAMLFYNEFFRLVRLLMESYERQITSRPKFIVLSTSYWYVKGTSNSQRH